MALTFRFAQETDTLLILQFIRELADYEHLLDQVVADEATLRDQLFEKRRAEVLFALEDGAEVGFALFFQNFVFCSSFSNCLSCDRGVPDEMIYAARQIIELANLTGRYFTTPVSPNHILS